MILVRLTKRKREVPRVLSSLTLKHWWNVKVTDLTTFGGGVALAGQITSREFWRGASVFISSNSLVPITIKKKSLIICTGYPLSTLYLHLQRANSIRRYISGTITGDPKFSSIPTSPARSYIFSTMEYLRILRSFPKFNYTFIC